MSNDLQFGLMIHGFYIYQNINIHAYLAYNETWEKYYFEQDITSNNITFFQDNREAERFFDMYESEIIKAGEKVFPEREHTNYNIIEFKPAIEETKPLTDLPESPTGEKTSTLSYLYIKLYDNNPSVCEVYFIGYNNDHDEDLIVTSRNFSDVELFPDKKSARKFFTKKEDKIRAVADKHRVDGIYKKVDICIMDAIINPMFVYTQATIPYEPKPICQH